MERKYDFHDFLNVCYYICVLLGMVKTFDLCSFCLRSMILFIISWDIIIFLNNTFFKSILENAMILFPSVLLIVSQDQINVVNLMDSLLIGFLN